MFTGFLLALREGLEAALIVGIVLGILKQLKKTEYGRWVWAGVFSAIVLSVLCAMVLYRLGIELEGIAEEIFEGLTMLLAAGVLTWMIFWMQKQAVFMRQQLEAKVSQAVSSTGRRGLFTLAFLAVVREGIELALFLTAAAFSLGNAATWQGAILGLAVSVALGWGFFAAAIRLDVKLFFRVTSLLLLLFAAGMVGHGVHEFNEVGWIPPIVEHLWDINPLFDEKSAGGSLFGSLFGYNGNPSLSEVAAYLGYVCLIGFLLKRSPSDRMVKKLA